MAEGDVVLMGTDGIFDNLHDQEVTPAGERSGTAVGGAEGTEDTEGS